MSSSSQQFASYDPKLISILEILGSQFVDIYFNHVYNSARAHLNTGESLTDEYTRRVQAYIVGVKDDGKSYREVVQNLHKYFQTTTRHTTLSFADFVERIVQQFIPAEYYGLLNAPEKDETLGSIIADLVSSLGAYVTSPDMIRRIIDEHDPPLGQPKVTIRMIQDQGVVILLTKRGEIHNSFLRRVGQAKEHVSADVVDDLKAAIRKLVRQKAELKTRLGECEDHAMDLEDTVGALKKKDAKYRKLIEMLVAERESGAQAAAFAASIPDRNHHAEGRSTDDPRPSVPPPNSIAESRDAGAGELFTSPFNTDPPESTGGRSAPFTPTNRVDRYSRHAGGVRPTAPVSNISNLFKTPGEEGEDGEDGEEVEEGDDGEDGEEDEEDEEDDEDVEDDEDDN